MVRIFETDATFGTLFRHVCSASSLQIGTFLLRIRKHLPKMWKASFEELWLCTLYIPKFLKNSAVHLPELGLGLPELHLSYGSGTMTEMVPQTRIRRVPFLICCRSNCLGDIHISFSLSSGMTTEWH